MWGKGVFWVYDATSTASVLSNSWVPSQHVSLTTFFFPLICKSVSHQERVGSGRVEVWLPVLILCLTRPSQGHQQGVV